MTSPTTPRPDRSDTAPYAPGPSPGFGLGPGMRTLADAAWQVLVAAGVVSVVLGIVVLVWPHATLAVVGVLFGIYLLINGVFQLAGAFGAHVPGTMRAVGFISGSLSIILGLICFRGAAESLLLLALWIGFGWLIQGVMLTAVALSTVGLPARGWQIFLGVLTALAGIVLIVAPFGSLTVLTVVSGIMLIVIGATEIVHAVQLRRLANSGPVVL